MGFWGKKTFCVITGSSRGIGQGLAQSFAKKVGKDSLLLLLARNESALEQTKSMILKDPEVKGVQIVTKSIDLGKPDGAAYKKVIAEALQTAAKKVEDFQQNILVQCAASYGVELGLRVDQLDDVEFIQGITDFNIAGFILLNTAFCKAVAPEPKEGATMIIHISSNGAIEPYKTWGLYCACRAAKNMMLRSIALESPWIQTLNYDPGMVETPGYYEVVGTTTDKDLAEAFEKVQKEGKLLQPMQTGGKLVEILEGGKYGKGEHISFYKH